MGKIDRLHELLKILHHRRYAVSLADLAGELECSAPTVKRYLATLRNEYGAPLRYDPGYHGYLLEKTDDESIQFPGLWFSVSELHALLVIQELIERLEPGFLKRALFPLRARIDRMLALRGFKSEELGRRIQFIGAGARLCSPHTFQVVADAVMGRKRIRLLYHGRGEDTVSAREISPQRLIYHRGNWYLAAWCHARKALRTLSIERMSEVAPAAEACVDIPEEALQAHFNASFGIFAGRPERQAVLHFSRESARWVAEEKWHPDQQGRWLADGGYELRLPYADQRELVMEILRYGPDVRVAEPPELQAAVRQRLALALGRYEKNEK